MNDLRVAIVGSINLDVVLRVSTLPRPGETVVAHGLSQVLGGKGANQAIAAASVALTDLIAEVGTDAASAVLLSQLQEAGVGTTHVGISPGPTGRAHIAVDEQGENSIIVVGGSNHHLSPVRVLEALDASSPAVVVIQCEVDGAVVRAVHKWAVTRSARLVLNASPVPTYLSELEPIADPLIVNRGEAETITGMQGASTLELAPALADRARSVVVTDGSQGSVVHRDGQTQSVPAVVARVIDTTGAGDAFAGVLAARLAIGEVLVDAVSAGAVEAARVISLRRSARSSGVERQ